MRYDHFNLLPARSFKTTGKRMTYEGGGKSEAPDTPDYTKAAEATAAGNAEAARIAAKANRVSQYTPYGNLVYKQDGGDQDIWSATQTLSPAEQAKLDKNNQLSLALLDTSRKGLAGVDQMLDKGFDFNALPAAQINAGQTAQDAIMARLNPSFAQDEEALRTRLVNQGVHPGSQAWANEFNNFNMRKNDAHSQAALLGIDVGQQARQQALQEQEFGRTEGLNIINSLRTGNQVQQPNFVNTPNQATTTGADYLGAVNGQYQGELGATNAANANRANVTNGLFGAFGNVASAYFRRDPKTQN